MDVSSTFPIQYR